MANETGFNFPDFSQFAFWGNNPNVNQQLRQRIALSMLSQKKGFPKTLGEGLTAIGDSIGDIGIMRRLEQGDLAAQAVQPPAAPSAPSTPGYAPSDGADAPAVDAINRAAPVERSAAPAVAPAAAPAETAQSSGGPVGIYNQGDYNEMDATGDATRRAGIAGIESGGSKDPYALTGAVIPRTGDRAYGKYQVMGANIPAWTKEATGTALTPQQFLANPQAQEATFHNRFGNYVNKYGEEGAARAWFGGEGGMNNPGATDVHGRLNVAGYGQDYLKRRDAAALALMQQGQPDQRLALAAPQGPATATGAAPAPVVPSVIPKAPPPARVAQAETYPPGYVPPPATDPQGVPIIPMKPREAQLRQWLAANQGNQYAPMKVQAELDALTNERTTRQNEANELFKAQIARATEQEKLRLQGQMDAPKRIADVAHTEAQTKAALLQDTEGKNVLDPVTGTYHRPIIEGADPNVAPRPKMTAEQAKDQKFHGWTSLAEEQMQGREDILAKGLQQEIAGKIPFVGNKFQQAEYRRVRGAAERFVQGFLRDISGAVISPEELVKHQNTFLPRYGDDPRTIADKREARQQIISGLYAGAGPGQEISDWEAKQRRTRQAERDTKVNEEMKDAAKVVGKIYINPETKSRRAWTGTRWEDL